MTEPQTQRAEEALHDELAGYLHESLKRAGLTVGRSETRDSRVLEIITKHLDTLTAQHQAALAQARAEEREWVLTRLIDEAAYLGVADGKVDKIIHEIRKRAASRQPGGSPGERGGQG